MPFHHFIQNYFENSFKKTIFFFPFFSFASSNNVTKTREHNIRISVLTNEFNQLVNLFDDKTISFSWRIAFI